MPPGRNGERGRAAHQQGVFSDLFDRIRKRILPDGHPARNNHNFKSRYVEPPTPWPGRGVANSPASFSRLQRGQSCSRSSMAITVGPPRWPRARLTRSAANGVLQLWHRNSLILVLNGEISTSSGCSLTEIAPTGQIAAHVPQPIQSSDG
jgi:hypothetical protein